jgi:hypothetical protein
MRQSKPAGLVLLILAFLSHARLSRAASQAPPDPRLAAPETRVQGYRVVVERLDQQQNLALEFQGAAAGKTTGSQQVFVALAVYPPNPKLAANVQGLDPRVLAFTDRNRPVNFQSYPGEESSPLGGGVWRTNLQAADVDLLTSRLHRLQGELIVYPRAKGVTLDFPLPANAPQTREDEGVRATLKTVRFGSGILSATVLTEWPSTLQVSRVNPDAPDGITALSRAGTALVPQSTGVVVTRRGPVTGQQYQITFAGLPELPTTLRVQMMVRSGAPQKLLFTLPDLALPDTLDLEAADGRTAASGPLRPGNPLYLKTGGTLTLPVRAAGNAGEGRLLVGLSRQEGGEFGPWRWLEVDLPKGAAGSLPNLAPGRYRVARSWTPEERPGGGLETELFRPQAAPAVEVVVEAGKTVSLPALEIGGRP